VHRLVVLRGPGRVAGQVSIYNGDYVVVLLFGALILNQLLDGALLLMGGVEGG
jgi:hypothetical protein